MREETFKIEGMSCQMCVKHVTKALQGVEGVSEVEVRVIASKLLTRPSPSSYCPTQLSAVYS